MKFKFEILWPISWKADQFASLHEAFLIINSELLVSVNLITIKD